MLLGGILVPLRPQRLQRADETWARVARIDDVVEVAAAGGDVGMRELLAILVDLAVRRPLRVGAVVDLFAKENLDRALRSHDRDLAGRPRDVVVAPSV